MGVLKSESRNRLIVEISAPGVDVEQAGSGLEKIVLSSLRRGAFVASSGAEFTRLTVAGSTITAEATPGTSLRFIGRGGRLLRAVSTNLGSYRATGIEGYVRVEAIRDDGARAWSQPFFISWR